MEGNGQQLAGINIISVMQ
uniref:Uncharacterized protein n=1 Tax=Rhizophora mucronata TaxID=61149 RepID=A0A2P2PHF3_RHIMU